MPTLTVTRNGSAEALQLPGARVKLTWSGGAAEAPLELAPVSVGTSADCMLVTTASGISRNHCELTLEDSGVHIRDLGSKNGTFVNGVRVIEAILPADAEVTLGAARLIVTADGKRSEISLSPDPKFGDAIGASVPMRALFSVLRRAANSEAPILLRGESGTGKETLARAIHAESPRRERRFAVLDCGSVAATLLESELFGHVRGAFTGAVQDREGLLASAHGGTLFLDEIGDLPLDLQPRLLRTLEDKEVRPVGANRSIRADVRVIAATHRDLRASISAGEFRDDLYYRFAVVVAHVPPLRERRDDIPLLVERFLAQLDPPRALHDLPHNLLPVLKSHAWPGNVRELKNTLTRLLVMGSPQLPAEGRPTSRPPSLSLRDARDLAIGEFEQKFLTQRLLESGGNVTAAARAMGVSRQLVHRLMVRYGIQQQPKDDDAD